MLNFRSQSKIAAMATSTPTLRSDQKKLITQKKQLRTQLRNKRQQLTRFEQHSAAKKLLIQLNHQTWFNNSQKVALYLANDSELSCAHVIRTLLQNNKQVFLPVLHPINHRQLLFVRYDQHTPMRFNRFGIKEPRLARSRLLDPSQLDIIFMPLVGFDKQGHRLGMGGGFYDTSLERVVNCRWLKSPKRVGIAHDCQQASELPQEPWDIQLNAIITPNQCILI